MSNMAIMCRCVEISLLGCVEQNVVQNVPSLTRFLPSIEWKLDSGLIGKTRDNQKTNRQNQRQSLSTSSAHPSKTSNTAKRSGQIGVF